MLMPYFESLSNKKMPNRKRAMRKSQLRGTNVPSGQQKNSASRIELKLPATSANLGPAFDAAALALELYLHVRAEVAEQFSIKAQGRDTHVCDGLDNNLIINTY